MAGGNYGPHLRPYPPGRGLLVLTHRRLLFLKDSTGKKFTKDFPLEEITSVEWSSRGLTGHVIVSAGGEKAEIKHVDKNDGKLITDLVSRVINL